MKNETNTTRPRKAGKGKAKSSMESRIPVQQVAANGERGGSDGYAAFLEGKSQLGGNHGFEPLIIGGQLFNFQKELVAFALRKGRSAIFADCGLGKTAMQLNWAQNVVEKADRPVLILTPLAVGAQTVKEGEKFGVECVRSRDGSLNGGRIVVTNYEKLHLFKSEDFAGIVCDESSIIKNSTGETKKAVTRFANKMPYRLLCTATAAPNDYVELGTSSEALGELGYTEMISRFFVGTEKVPHRMQKIKDENKQRGQHFAKLSFRVHQNLNKWTLKGHAEEHFWRWVASWSRACRMPSDLGFDNGEFELPPLEEHEHTVESKLPAEGLLFTIPAVGLNEEREERRRTLPERCRMAADLVKHDRPAVIWCHLNKEGDELERIIPGAVQVSGSDSDDEKETAFNRFSDGTTRVLIIKPKIGAHGLNWQHCAHVVTFASHSYEQYYQSVRRCWRFGQKNPVRVDIISASGETHVRDNMRRKADMAGVMFESLVRHMNNALNIKREEKTNNKLKLPKWL